LGNIFRRKRGLNLSKLLVTYVSIRYVSRSFVYFVLQQTIESSSRQRFFSTREIFIRIDVHWTWKRTTSECMAACMACQQRQLSMSARDLRRLFIEWHRV